MTVSTQKGMRIAHTPAAPDAMLASARLAEFRALGFSVRAEGGKLWIQPASRLTDQQRKALTTLKGPILELLEEELRQKCPLCKRPLDEKRRCWKCHDRVCDCGKLTGSAFIETCLVCQMSGGTS